MAQYKVPQDVEADDKLIGPFGFRQFIYLLVAAGFGALAYALFTIFPFFAIIPLPVVIFLLILALPLKKDQPMETYVAALIQFYKSPRTRFWNPGQRESTIEITAPKVIEEIRARNISGDDASRRLSFLANVVDSEGYSIKNGAGPVRDEFIAEANATPDMFDIYETQRLSNAIADDSAERHAALVEQMRTAINQANSLTAQAYNPATVAAPNPTPTPAFTNPIASKLPSTPPVAPTPSPSPTPSAQTPQPQPSLASTLPEPTPAPEPEPSPEIFDLAHNDEFTIATIAKEANRISRKADDKEVYISLH